MHTPIHQTQFINLLKFVAITSHNKYVLELSPDYIVEKFKLFISEDITILNNDNIMRGLQPNVETEIIDPYMKKWLSHINRNDGLADILL